MEWLQQLLQLLFGTLGPLGTVCVAAAVYSGWLHYNEKEDHKRTRDLVAQDAERRLALQREFLEVLTEIKVMLQSLEGRQHG